MNLRDRFLSQYPDAFFLQHEPSSELADYLRSQHWLADDEALQSVEKPGEGNMNFVARIITNRRSFIIKQAYPWVYKFPQVAAPIHRGKSEAIFYQLLEDDPVLTACSPKMIGFDPQSYVLAQEDLGEGYDFTFLYQDEENMTLGQLKQLLNFLARLHQIKASPEATQLENRLMRTLNHEHIFKYPLMANNGLDLDSVLPGLSSAAASYRQNKPLQRKFDALGSIYLENGDTLIHGDFYPGSWLRVADQVRVIDPEFGFFGRAEFDVGVMAAHAMLVQDTVYTSDQILTSYPASAAFDQSLARAFAGVEVIRRLLGLAQLPISHSLEKRVALLERAVAML